MPTVDPRNPWGPAPAYYSAGHPAVAPLEVWEVDDAGVDTDRLDYLLETGWEPFAVTFAEGRFGGLTYHLRRRNVHPVEPS